MAVSKRDKLLYNLRRIHKFSSLFVIRGSCGKPPPLVSSSFCLVVVPVVVVSAPTASMLVAVVMVVVMALLLRLRVRADHHLGGVAVALVRL